MGRGLGHSWLKANRECVAHGLELGETSSAAGFRGGRGSHDSWVCAAAAHSAYLDFVAQDVTPDMDAEMRGRMEFHAWETAHFGFWLMLIGAFPYLAGVLLVGGLVIVSLRPKS